MKTPEHIYQPACARCRDEAGKDRAGVVDTSLCNWHTNDLVLSLRAEVERLRLGNIRLRSVAESATEVSCARTGSISHRCGECRACMVRVRASAALTAPAEEEGRDA